MLKLAFSGDKVEGFYKFRMQSTRKLKILFIVSTLRRTGPTNQLFNIVSNIDSSKFESLILTLSPEPEDSLRVRFLSSGIKLESLNIGRISGIFSFKRKLRKALQRISPDIVHSQGIRADHYLSDISIGHFKKIATIRCNPYEDYTMNFGTLKGRLMARRHLKSLRKFDQVVSVSKVIQAALKEYAVDTIAIQNGCDIERFRAVSLTEKQELRRSLGLPIDKQILVSVGSLSKRKDPLTIIEAFKSYENKENSYLVFIGEGDLKDQCEQAASGVGNIAFLGQSEKVERYLSSSDVFISASLSEGLPNAVLEAMSCGIPVILSNIPQHKELFEVMPVEPPFFNVGSVSELTQILNGLKQDDMIRQLDTEKVKDHFSSENMSKRYQDVYSQLTSA